ncbi:MAG: hypothetical protein ACAI44_25770 [Candidatus Sericytochromatia bacterium]
MAENTPQNYLVTSPGISATRWLSFALAQRPDVYITHGHHPLESIIKGDPDAEKDDSSSFTSGIELKAFYDSQTLSQVFERYREIMPEARAYGNIHSYTLGVLMQKASPEELAEIRLLNLLRHPVSYLASHVALVRNAEAYPEVYSHYQQNMLAEALQRFPELLLLDCPQDGEFLAFAVSTLSVCKFADDFAHPGVRHVQMERLTSETDALQEFCEYLTGLPYQRELLQAHIDNGPVNAHRRQGREPRTPQETYEGWQTWQQDMVHMMVPQDVKDAFAAVGYDVSMMNL